MVTRRRVVSVVTGLLVVAAGAGLEAGSASAAPAGTAITCGGSFTGHLYLAADLDCDHAAIGITLHGDVTLDLRGHRLRDAVADDGPPSIGIQVEDIEDQGQIVVKGGTLTGWGIAVNSWTEPDDDVREFGTVRLEGVRLAGNTTAVRADSQLYSKSRLVVVRHSLLTGNERALSSLEGASLRVEMSVLRGNRSAGYAQNGYLNVDHSLVTGSGTAFDCAEGGCSFNYTTFSGNTTAIRTTLGGAFIRNSAFIGNDVAYDSVFDEFRSVVTDNWFEGNRIGVRIGATELGGSRLTWQVADIERNVFQHNQTAITAADDPPDPDADPEETPMIRVVGNTFQRNGDAIHLPALAQLKDNSATRNRGWGIYAPYAIDLGGNTASGNGRSPQCTGVACP